MARIEEVNQEIDKASAGKSEASVTREKLQGQISVLETKIKYASGDEEHLKRRSEEVRAQLEQKKAEQKQALDKKSDADKKMAEVSEKRAQAQAKLEEISAKRQSINEAIDAAGTRKYEALNERSQVQSRLSALSTRQEEINKRRSELTSRLIRAESEESRYKETIKELNEDFERISGELQELRDEENKLADEQSSFKERLIGADADLIKAQERYHSENSRLEALINLTERYEGYGGSVKRVMEQKKADRDSGIIGVVADIIKTGKEYETAIEVALGGNIQNIVTKDEESAKRMIGILKNERAGRATFLPLTSIKEPQEFKTPEVLKEKGVIGLASDLVETEARYADVARSLLGRIVVVDDVDRALKIARKNHYGIRMVTTGGELLTPGGAISGGAFKGNSNLLGRRREIEDLRKSVEKAQKDADDAQLEIINVKKERNEVRARLDHIKVLSQNKLLEQNAARLRIQNEEEKKKGEADAYRDLQTENEDISGRLADLENEKKEAEEALKNTGAIEEECAAETKRLQDELSGVMELEDAAAADVKAMDIEVEKISQSAQFEEVNCGRIDGEVKEIEASLSEIEESLENNVKTLEENKRDIEEIKKTIELSYQAEKDAEEKHSSMTVERDKLSKQQKEMFENAAKSVEELTKKREELSERRNMLDAEIARLAMRKDQLQNSLESQINYMWSEYEITLSDAAGMRDESLGDIPSMKRKIASLKGTLKGLGEVNVGAIEEYRVVNEDYTLKKSQYDDLDETGKKVRQIIQELDQNMRDTFTSEFERINKEFGVVFREMFGGGKGSLELIEDEDVLVAGIRIIAQPPGKRLQNMMQLSGGEKALTAIALLFAIQNLKPSPFCLLDEIEAALDENNVVRFARYLHKLTRSIQFIVITHRRGTMDSADRLYGITMQEKGVSALVSVDLIEKDIE